MFNLLYWLLYININFNQKKICNYCFVIQFVLAILGILRFIFLFIAAWGEGGINDLFGKHFREVWGYFCKLIFFSLYRRNLFRKIGKLNYFEGKMKDFLVWCSIFFIFFSPNHPPPLPFLFSFFLPFLIFLLLYSICMSSKAVLLFRLCF